MADEAVRDARDAVLEAYDDSMTSPNFEADREHDDRFIAALDAYEAAIRADERAKMTRTAVALGMHEPADCKAQGDSALRAAALEAAILAENIAAHIDDLGGSGGDTVWSIASILHTAIDAVRAGRMS